MLVYWTSMAATQKITIEVPTSVLKQAQLATGEGITATVRRGLELVSARHAREELLNLRGKVKFSKSWRELKDDR
jgi:antitoxin component of MazEF toxin-antitoxin module